MTHQRFWTPLALFASMTTVSPPASASTGSELGSGKRRSDSEESGSERNGEHVVLLHGLARTPRCMTRMERSLTSEGYTVHNVGYPSRKFSAAELVANHVAPAVERCRKAGAKRVHFVGHSLGAILIRLYKRDHDFRDMGRVVMLGPPNQGSQVVDRLGHLKLYHWINGPAGNQLGTDTDSLPLSLGPIDFEAGIIAGNRSINPILSRFIPGTNDGKVSIENTHVEGAADHRVVRSSHTYLMNNRKSIKLVRHFLAHGNFGAAKKP